MIRDKIKALLASRGITQRTIACNWGIAEQQLNNSIRLNRLGSKELIRLAADTGTQLAFIDDNGKPIVVFSVDDLPTE